MERTGGPVKNLHKRTSELVNAGSQAKLILCLQDDLTEEESLSLIHIYLYMKRSAALTSSASHDSILVSLISKSIFYKRNALNNKVHICWQGL